MQNISISECSSTPSQIKDNARSLQKSCSLYFDFNNPSEEQILAVAESLPRGAMFTLHPETSLDLFVFTAQNLNQGHFFKIHPKTPNDVFLIALDYARAGVIVTFSNSQNRLFGAKPRDTLESREEFHAKLALLTKSMT
jgi:hypothetical protein